MAAWPLLQPGYFSMHDIQHPVRLFLLKQGLNQGYLYPRWVADLGFGFGYPLFNFYPPLIYYVSSVFLFFGFSIINSLKAMLIVGFLLASISSYCYAKLFLSRRVALIASAFYTYTFYHAITVYIRGAFAEFFSYGLFPFVAFFLHSLILKPNWTKVLGLGFSFAMLLLCHPLIAFPSVFFIVAYFILGLLISKQKILVFFSQTLGLLLGLGLSAFFWLPSLVEKKYTLVDDILTRELYNYQLHFVELKQLYFSPWGFGGSTFGAADGFSYQIGKYYLFFLGLSIIIGIYLWLRKPLFGRKKLMLLGFNLFLLIFSYFMSLSYSQFIWNKIKYLWYLQFPWRFFTFAAIYLSVVAASAIDLWTWCKKSKFWKIAGQVCLLFLVGILIMKYSKLFQPQKIYQIEDAQITNKHQRQWIISKTSFEFVPKGVSTTLNNFGVTTLAIKKKNLPKKSFKILSGQVLTKKIESRFMDKKYLVKVEKPAVFQLNTYYFPGWVAYLNGEELKIDYSKKLKLIRVSLPKGNYALNFRFGNTKIRVFSNYLSLFSLIFFGFFTVIILAQRIRGFSFRNFFRIKIIEKDR